MRDDIKLRGKGVLKSLTWRRGVVQKSLTSTHEFLMKSNFNVEISDNVMKFFQFESKIL